jgi:hypothetical protein
MWQGKSEQKNINVYDFFISIIVSKYQVSKYQVSKHQVSKHQSTEFKASIGWLQKFMDRHNFVAREPTTVCQKPPKEYEHALVNLVMYISQLREKNNFQHIYAADETAVWLDSTGGKCIADKGAKEVSVLTTGHDKMRITVFLTGRSDGYKCLPYVLLPRKRVDPIIVNKFKNKLHLAWEGTNWMNDDLTADYLKRVLGKSLFGKRLLVWDSFRCHISQSTKKALKASGLDTAVVPGRLFNWRS